MTDYGVIYEQADDGNWNAHAADLPVFSCGDTRQEAEQGIREAIALYLDQLSRSGEPAPEARSFVGTVSV
jgi:predicted RNase H-like HicB family nuclease